MEDGARRRDLEDRTFRFAESVRAFVKQLPRTISNDEDVRQLVRSSGSVAVNWVEADEALSKKDFLLRVKICRKEAKESRLFLRLMDAGVNKIALQRARSSQLKRANWCYLLRDHFEDPMIATSDVVLVIGAWLGSGNWDLGF
jgi:four helix bundle protein